MRNEYDEMVIPTYILRAAEQSNDDRIINGRFGNHAEFDLRFLDGSDDSEERFRICLYDALREADNEKFDVMLFCRGGVALTSDYQRDTFLDSMTAAAQKGAQVMYADVGDFGCAVPYGEHLWWVDWTREWSMMAIFRPAFKIILQSRDSLENLDAVLSETLCNKFLLFPFMAERGSKESENTIVLASSHKPSAKERLEKLRMMAKSLCEKKSFH